MVTKEDVEKLVLWKGLKTKNESGTTIWWTKPLKLYLGNGFEYWEDFINIDLNESCAKSDLYMDCTDLSVFEDSSVDEIHTYHTVEHIGHRRLVPAFIEWRRVLKPGGKLIVEMPNLSAIVDKFASIRYNSGEIKGDFGDNSVYETLYGGQKDAGSFHISMLTPYLFMCIVKAAGFEEVDNVTGEYKIIREVPLKGKEYGYEWNMRFTLIK